MRRRSGSLVPLEVSILEAAVALRRRGTTDFHGYAVAKGVKTQDDRRRLTGYGTLYRALHRLERAGLVASFWEDPAVAEQESRPRRRLYRLTALADVALARARGERRTAGRLRALEGALGTRGAR